MTAIEDPASQLSSKAADADQPNDELENWLSDLRTDAAADPAEWINKSAGPEHRTDRRPLPQDQGETDAPAPRSGGRHRASD